MTDTADMDGASIAPAEIPAASPAAEEVDAETAARIQALGEEIVGALHSVYDPEIPVDIYELGLIYAVDVSSDGDVRIEMTLTSPSCPVAGTLPGEVQARVDALPGVRGTEVALVWEPPWDPSMMSDAARVELNMF